VAISVALLVQPARMDNASVIATAERHVGISAARQAQPARMAIAAKAPCAKIDVVLLERHARATSAYARTANQ
jgi:hypothetical protein